MPPGLKPVVRPCKMGGQRHSTMRQTAPLSALDPARRLRRGMRIGHALRRRLVATLALVAYLSGSLGLAAPTTISGSVDHILARPAGCACPDDAIRAGTCCCSGKALARPCCARHSGDPGLKQQVRDANDSDSAPAPHAGRNCCRHESSPRPTGPQFNSCSCGHSGPDQYLLCGDPRLFADPVRFQFIPDLAAVSPTSLRRPARAAHEPPTPPPRSIGG